MTPESPSPGHLVRPNTIRHVPPELLAIIFKNVGLEHPRRLVNIVSVCREWREIIYNYPKFWTTLILHAGEPRSTLNTDVVAFLKRWFAHAKNLPLKLNMAVVPARPSAIELQNLTEYLVSHQWRSLLFELRDGRTSQNQYSRPDPWPWLNTLFNAAKDQPDCWSELEELQMIATELNPRHMPILSLNKIAPNLKRLRIHFDRIPSVAYLNSTHINMKNLVSLNLDGEIGWDNHDAMLMFYFRTIMESNNLESFKIIDYYQSLTVPTFEFSTFVSSFPVSNLTLSHIALHDSPTVRFILKNLSLPSLVSVSMTRTHFDAIFESCPLPLHQSLSRLIELSGCNLEELKLDHAVISEEGLLALLPVMPTLQTLSLDSAFRNSTKAVAFLAGLRGGKEDSKLLPCLRSLSISVGAWITPTLSLQLKSEFLRVVCDPRRWWKPTAIEGDSTLVSERFAKITAAKLSLHHMDESTSTLYARPAPNRILAPRKELRGGAQEKRAFR